MRVFLYIKYSELTQASNLKKPVENPKKGRKKVKWMRNVVIEQILNSANGLEYVFKKVKQLKITKSGRI